MEPQIRTLSVICFIALLIATAAGPAWPADSESSQPTLSPFSSDGCSLFPDGTIRERAKWCDCCLNHDIAYWQGGTADERLKADEVLRDCVLERTGDKALAETMYLGVRAGGHPAFPTWYRWAYGWKYGRAYQPLSDDEKQQAKARIEEYYRTHPGGYCREHHRQQQPHDTTVPAAP